MMTPSKTTAAAVEVKPNAILSWVVGILDSMPYLDGGHRGFHDVTDLIEGPILLIACELSS